MLDAAAVKALALSLGAEQCGIARADSFLEAPEGFQPRDIYDQCQSVVVFMKAMPLEPARAANPEPYSSVARGIYAELDRLGLDLAQALEERGAPAVPLPCDTPYRQWDPDTGQAMGILSMRHAAQLAGLGRLGRNSLILNEELGNRGCIGAVLTAAELDPDPPIPGSPCPDTCRICQDACPENALVGKTVLQQRCRKSALAQGGLDFCSYDCHKCRSECPRGLGWGRGRWRKDFSNLGR